MTMMNERLDDYMPRDTGPIRPPMPPFEEEPSFRPIRPPFEDPGYTEPSLRPPMPPLSEYRNEFQPPVGEMVPERMEWASPNQNFIREAMDRNWKGFYEQPPFVPSPAELADIERTTTMGTGWGRQPLIDSPPTYDYAGTGGLGGLPPSPFIPTANTLLPPAGQEMMGNWGGGAANRQEWAGPLANPLMSPWAGAYSDPYNFFFQGGSENYNRTNPNWVGAQRSIWDQQYNDMRNYGLPLALAAMNPMIYPFMQAGQGIQGGSDWLRSRGY